MLFFEDKFLHQIRRQKFISSKQEKILLEYGNNLTIDFKSELASFINYFIPNPNFSFEFLLFMGEYIHVGILIKNSKMRKHILNYLDIDHNSTDKKYYIRDCLELLKEIKFSTFVNNLSFINLDVGFFEPNYHDVKINELIKEFKSLLKQSNKCHVARKRIIFHPHLNKASKLKLSETCSLNQREQQQLYIQLQNKSKSFQKTFLYTNNLSPAIQWQFLRENKKDFHALTELLFIDHLDIKIQRYFIDFIFPNFRDKFYKKDMWMSYLFMNYNLDYEIFDQYKTVDLLMNVRNLTYRSSKIMEDIKKYALLL